MMARVAIVAMAVMVMGSSASAQADGEPPVARATLVIVNQPADELLVPVMIDELQPETLLAIRASGFDSNTTGTIQQCVIGASHRCGNRLDVRFDDNGDATFQYFVTNRLAAGATEGGACRLQEAPCTIELVVADSSITIDTIFIDTAPPLGRINVRPDDGLAVGDIVTVTLTDFPPAADLALVFCASPSTSGSRCGSPSPVRQMTMDSDGGGQTELSLDVVEVGEDRIACGRRVTCSIVVASDQRGVRARPAKLSFSEFPGANYDATRLVIGIGAATMLLLLAGWLVRSIGWQPPREADSSSIDAAEYADLDLEAAEFEKHDRNRIL